jgi:hypothetical protein
MWVPARTSETSVDIQLRTRQYIPEDSELHNRRRENLKSHGIKVVFNVITSIQNFIQIHQMVQKLLRCFFTPTSEV